MCLTWQRTNIYRYVSTHLYLPLCYPEHTLNTGTETCGQLENSGIWKEHRKPTNDEKDKLVPCIVELDECFIRCKSYGNRTSAFHGYFFNIVFIKHHKSQETPPLIAKIFFKRSIISDSLLLYQIKNMVLWCFCS